MGAVELPDLHTVDDISLENNDHADDPHLAEKGASSIDGADMARMGKRQELRRNFKFLGIIGFVTILQATWENVLLANWFGLYNGGTAGLIWCTIAVWLLMLCMIGSLAEMASMAPTSGGQYHWSLSYVVGWCCCLGWISGVPSCCIQLALLVQTMVQLTFPNVNVTDLWMATLMLYAFLFLAVGFNIFFAQHLPFAEGIILCLHVLSFFAFLLLFWIMSDHAPASQVFTEFNDGGGWGNMGLSCLIGLATPVWCFIGPDAGAHMSEELKDASVQLPRAMIWATVLNGVLGVTMLITFCFCITDLQALLGDESGVPIIGVIQQATGSHAATCILGTVLMILMFFSTVTTVASSSRQIWAFSRDQGFPFSQWIRFVPPTYEIPVNALLVCLGACLIISAINFGSNAAFNAVISLSNAALAFSYIVSIGCLRLKRFRGEPLLPRRWSLGRWGWLVNDISLIFLVIIFIFSFFPTDPMVGDPGWAKDMNWSIVMFAGTCLLALAYYIFGGRSKYVPPVALCKQE